MSRDIPEMSNEDAELFDSPEDAETAHHLMDQIESQLEAREALRERLRKTEHQRDMAQRQRDEWSAAFDKMERQKDKLLDLLALWLEHELSYSSISFDELVQKTQDTIDELKEGKNE